MLFRNSAFDLFDEMFGDPFFGQTYTERNVQVMRTDVQEEDNHYLVDIELPGYGKEDVQAELKDGYLTITASKNENKDEKNKDGTYIRRECFSGTCKRSFFVGEGVRQEDIQAGFKDGILRLSVPKAEAVKEKNQPKLITIR